MKTRLFGLACALASAAAAAQTSGVTLYGVVDANVEYTNHNLGSGSGGQSRVALNSGGLSPSRWGLRGTEDLGGGKRAIFALESGFSLDTGSSTQGGRLFGRQAWVGLGAGGHQVTLGRQYTSLFLMMANYSPTAYATTYEPVVGIAGANLREDNMVKYHLDLGPLAAEMHWSFGEQPGTVQGSAGYGAGFDYRIGQLGIAGAYDSINSAKTAGNFSRTQKAAVGLRYQITPDLLMQAAYRYNNNGIVATNTAARDDMWWFALNYQASGALQLTGAFYYDNVKRLYTATGVTSPRKPWQVTLIADYSLSKRTDVYLSTAYTKNAALNFENLNGAIAAYQIAPNEKDQLGVAVGLRHKF
ncbi:porin [Cupriavidus sp. USMAA2-4]|uniref:Porin n=1 Tax=Cupriavidus malaysiensis TaxID=367825 RepID=A0ABN4TS92_9BURK|nr:MULTISPECIES: porin [Cupriavidus]AOY96299.1 porin [Cupriavidus sp. USMAA2-4]AOZ03299.1 porin [Cupriavidus sp. USMAHM13]AOZ09339.1 porin [Cupriavidus malaysiensis]